MRKILGLDLGTNSIGWALVEQDDNSNGSIIKLGVRVCPLSIDEQRDFTQGKSITTNAVRTAFRSARRNLQRYKLRREVLIKLLIEHGFISPTTPLYESGKGSTFETYNLRERAVTQEISLQEFARVLLQINKKRGYKSSKKVNALEDGQAVDAMDVAERLYNEGITPAELTYKILSSGSKNIPDFYRSDLQNELMRIWNFQKQFYPNILTDDFLKQITNRGKQAIIKIFYAKYSISTAENNGGNKKMQPYLWRIQALSHELKSDVLSFVVSDLVGIISNSSGYLGSISDRSKELHFNKMTVGQYLMSEQRKDSNYSFKNKVFYRRDYLDEFNALWDEQSKYHAELTYELKCQIANTIIFYQRALKSQKNLISFCEFENKEIVIDKNGNDKKVTIGLKVAPKSSFLFQDYKVWCILNNIKIKNKITGEISELSLEHKNMLFRELSVKASLSANAVLGLLYGKIAKDYEINYKKIEGNETQAHFFEKYLDIVNLNGKIEYDFSKMKYDDIVRVVTSKFEELGFKSDFLYHDSSLPTKDYEKQSIFKLWHLLYSFESDDSRSGNDRQIDKIIEITGFDRVCASKIAGIGYMSNYGSLSSKAMRKILSYLKDGLRYDEACDRAGYRHSASSLTADEIASRELMDRLEPLKKNSLRNPVVEKILNQMVHVVNGVIDEYGRPDEIHIELARELKKSAAERESMTKNINNADKLHKKYEDLIKRDFGFSHISRNDIIRYKLYLELESRGHKTLYSNTYIPYQKLYTNEFNVEHIIPQAKLFDDSFSNKTLETAFVNVEKSNKTAIDYMESGRYSNEQIAQYKSSVELMYKKGAISKSKYDKLLLRESDIKSGFIERDLRDSQYIAKVAKSMLYGVSRVVVSTTGTITERLRRDWQLVDVMKEMNWNKYDKLGMTEVYDKKGERQSKINGWTKRNDHRHHAMDALTVAFTKHSHIQYFNNLNAKSDRDKIFYAIERREFYRNENNKLVVNSPCGKLSDFRAESKRHLEGLLISIKAKNKVVTKNKNKDSITQLTPRGKLHNETVHGSRVWSQSKLEKVGASFDSDKINCVKKRLYRDLLLNRLEEFGMDAKKAFMGKNNLDKNPIYIDNQKVECIPSSVEVVYTTTTLTKRCAVGEKLDINNVVDNGIKQILLERVKRFNGNTTEAFSNLDEDPILDHRGVRIKKVIITVSDKGEAIHSKRGSGGELIYDEQGDTVPCDYVCTSNNHHVEIFADANGNYQERIVSFYEATALAVQHLSVIDYDYRKSDGWVFLFTLKQNEYFVFPNSATDFNPLEVDLMDRTNYALISPNLYRVQKFSSKYYVFRHHLETMVDNSELKMKDVTFKRVTSLKNLEGMVKVRINHVGDIVHVGEY